MNKILNKKTDKTNKKLNPSSAKKTVIKRPGLTKRQLEARIYHQTANGVALVTAEEVAVLKIRLSSKGTGSILINDILFSCEKITIANQKRLYVFKRTIDKDNIKSAALIGADQAAKIGLREGIDQVKVGNSYYKIHYVDYADFPNEFKQSNKITKPLEDFHPQEESNISSQSQLSQFFEELRQRRQPQQPTPTDAKTASLDPTTRRLTVTNLRQGLTPKTVRSKQYYDLTDLKQGTLAKQKTAIDQDLDTDLKRETELELSRSTATAPEEFEVDFTYRQYKTVNDFWTKLFNFYNVNLVQWEKRVAHLKSQDSINPIYDLEQEYLSTVMNSKNNPGRLLVKQNQLAKQENELSQKLATLRLVLVSNEIDPKTNEEYLALNKEHHLVKSELAEIESRLNFLKENPQNRDYQAGRRQFIEIIGFNDVIHKNQDLVIDKSLALDQDLNAIEDDKVHLEKLLKNKLLALNQAKQTKIKLEKERLQLIAKNTELEDDDARLSNHLADLAERGRIHEKNALIQAEINRERNRLNNSIANLEDFDTYEDYEKEVKTLEREDQELSGRKSQLDDLLVTAKHKILHERKIIADECEASRKFFLALEKDVLDLISDFERQSLFSLENVRKLWNEHVVYELNSVYNRNNNILTQVANVALSQMERLSVEQVRLCEIFDQEQTNWLKLFQETTQEFRLQGLYIPPSQVKKVKQHNRFNFGEYPISQEVMKIINLEYNPEYTTEPEVLSRQQKKNIIIGLDPITKDDLEYEIEILPAVKPEPAPVLANDHQEQGDQAYIDSVDDLITKGELKKAENLAEERHLKKILEIEENEALVLSRYLKSLRSNNIASAQNKMLHHADQLLEDKKAWFEANDIHIGSQKPTPDPDALIPDNSLSYKVRKDFNKPKKVDRYAELIGENDAATEKSIFVEEEIFGGDTVINEAELEAPFKNQFEIDLVGQSHEDIPDLSGRSILFADDNEFHPTTLARIVASKPKDRIRLKQTPQDIKHALANEEKLLMENADTAKPIKITKNHNDQIIKQDQFLKVINDDLENELIKARNDLEHSGKQINNLLKED